MKWDYDPRVSLQKVAMPMDADGATRMPVWLFVACDGTRIISSLPVQVEVTQSDRARIMQTPHTSSRAGGFMYSLQHLHTRRLRINFTTRWCTSMSLPGAVVMISRMMRLRFETSYRTHFQVSAEPHRG